MTFDSVSGGFSNDSRTGPWRVRICARPVHPTAEPLDATIAGGAVLQGVRLEIFDQHIDARFAVSAVSLECATATALSRWASICREFGLPELEPTRLELQRVQPPVDEVEIAARPRRSPSSRFTSLGRVIDRDAELLDLMEREFGVNRFQHAHRRHLRLVSPLA